MLAVIVITTFLLCFLAYRFYGAFLERHCQIDDARETPACAVNDGVDYVPTRASVLFGHHFSSIAGAGPIVGPIVAAALFGWGPTWAWILVGAIFVGGVHDFGSTVMSLRYGGRSIVETSRRLVGERTGKLFMLFVIVALVYVIIVFLDLTAMSFVADGSVSTASTWFVAMAFVFGFVINRTPVSFRVAVPFFVLLTYAGFALGKWLPMEGVGKETWLMCILGYCYIAAILPVGVLMQPRDFLSATFLYAMMGLGVLGLLVSGKGFEIELFTSFNPRDAVYLMPMLFITVACGACSGFHSIVASGTTSKQIKTEGDVRKVTYGGMLVEGLLATFALACIGVLGGMQEGGAVVTYAKGAAVFFGSFGVPEDLGASFALLAVSTFLLTTLDTCTRLTRFLVEELFDWRNAYSRYLGTLLVLVAPAWFAFQTYPDAAGNPVAVWKAIWPLFGATNQLLAALALITFTVFLRSRRLGYWFALVPACVMILMPLWALALMTWDRGRLFAENRDLITGILSGMSGAMFVLGIVVIGMSVRYVVRGAPAGTATGAGETA